VNAHRRHWYFAMMGTCVVLFVLAWSVVRLWSVPAAIAMCLVAMVIPPVAAIVANRRGPEDRWWDDPPLDPPDRESARPEPPPPPVREPQPPGRRPRGRSGDPESDRWWDELDRRSSGPPERF
jgi:hypothetical protein